MNCHNHRMIASFGCVRRRGPTCQSYNTFGPHFVLQQLPPLAAAIHLPCMAKPWLVLPDLIMSERETTERFPIWKCLRSSIENALVTSEWGPWDLLPFGSRGEVKLLLWDSTTVQSGDLGAFLSLLGFIFSSLQSSFFLVFKKRPPFPLGRRIAWRWREKCKYGYIKNPQ